MNPPAAPRDPRLVVVLLRGGLDGLAAVAPYGDPRLARLRPHLALPEPGREGGLHDLGGFWGLHPALARCHAMYAAGEMLAVPAVAGPYRTRSHFEALHLLETGDPRATSGWLNRAAGEFRATRAEDACSFAPALALGAVQPLILQGDTRVGAWARHDIAQPPSRFHDMLAALRGDEPEIAAAVAARRFASGVLAQPALPRGGGFADLATVAGRLLAASRGPRIALLELEGWDTHGRQHAMLDWALRDLDGGLAALKASLGPAWRESAVLVISEFGRTVRGNGTGGTDHGTGGVALLLGGAIAGGVVGGDWPGLAEADLYEGRDLWPTTGTQALAKALLGGHLGLDAAALARVFPGDRSDTIAGLLRDPAPRAAASPQRRPTP